MKKTGTQILLECLKKEGVEVIFNYPVGAILPITDELLNWEFRTIRVRHEQGGVHAADGYARASGKTGVVIVTSGPGATNTVTGLVTAFMDSVPMVVCTGQVPTNLIGNDAFQEADIVGISRPCTKHNYLVTDVKNLAETMRRAFYIARTGRPGPVLVDLPKDVMTDTTTVKIPEQISIRGYRPTLNGNVPQIKKALKLAIKAARPVIYAGGGVVASGGSEELLQLAETLQIPVTMTLMGLGGFPGTHPLSLGMLGMHGTYRANMAVTESDLLIAVGARFDDRVTGKIDAFAPRAKKIHIDVDPTSISKNVRVDIPIVGDCKRVLNQMLSLLQEEQGLEELRESMLPWHERISEWRRAYRLAYVQEHIIKPQYVVEKLYEITQGEAIVATEVGQNQMWTAQYYHFNHPRSLLTSGGLGTMGYGFPAAIGAQIAFPDRIVIDIAGDGSIQMNIQELATAVQYRLPVKVAILNNGYLGMVRQWQELFFEKRYAQTELSEVSPDFVKLAEAYGAMGLRAERPHEVVPVIKEALRTPLPVLMDFRVAPEEGVYPMVPSGGAINEMLLL